MKTIALVEPERRVGKEPTSEVRYCLSSLDSEAKQMLGAVRGHWGIENSLHWVLDIAFREDESRIRKGHAPENLALMRHLALNLLKQERSAEVGTNIKRLKAGRGSKCLLAPLGASTTARSRCDCPGLN